MGEVGVVIPAGGRGERAGAGAPKQFRPIAGVPMLLRTILPFAVHPEVHRVLVAVPPATLEHPPDWLRDVQGERLCLCAGGATRAASVRHGLTALPPEVVSVLVHDAARPFVASQTIDAVIAQVRTGVGAVAAVPVADTIKRGDEQGMIVETVDRATLWRAQTPQAFPRSLLERAYDAWPEDGPAPTDEAQLVERLGEPVRLVPDLTTNVKITTADDFALAELLASR